MIRAKLSTRSAIIFAMTFVFTACGKKKSENSDASPTYVQALALGSDAMGYGIKVLASSNKTSPSAQLTSTQLTSNLIPDGETLMAAASVQDADLPDCSEDGEPWDQASGARMTTSNAKYAQTVFYCQVNSKLSPDTLAGSLNQYKAILCDVERIIGSIDYTDAGTEYKDRTLTITESCGWSQKAIEEMSGKPMTANLTAYSLSTGDWQKRVHVTVPNANFDFNIYFTIKSNLVGFKFVEAWDQDQRSKTGDSNANIPSTTTGTRGSVVTIDTTNGILRAESVDTYWSRRFRFFIKGTLDNTTGTFTTITDGQGIVANFDNQSGLSSDIASSTGNDADGFTFGAYQYGATSITAVRATASLSTNSSRCSKTGGCAGQTGISFSATSPDFDFLMIGAVWDSQTGKRSDVESWITAAGAPTFTGVTKAITL